MDISGVSSGVVVSVAQNNGDAVTSEVVRQTLETESQTKTQTADAVSQPTKAVAGNNEEKSESRGEEASERKLASEGSVGTRFNASV